MEHTKHEQLKYRTHKGIWGDQGWGGVCDRQHRGVQGGGGVCDRQHTDLQGGITALYGRVMVFTCHRIPFQTQPVWVLLLYQLGSSFL